MSISPQDRLVQLAYLFVGVREEGSNRGPLIEMFQKFVDGQAQGEPYCMAFVQWCLWQVDQETRNEIKSWPGHGVYRSESCLNVWNMTRRSLRLSKPEVGSLIFWQHYKLIKDSKGRVKNELPTRAGHVGICVNPVNLEVVETIEANTGPSNINVVREGDGIFLKTRRLDSDVGAMRYLGAMGPWEP